MNYYVVVTKNDDESVISIRYQSIVVIASCAKDAIEEASKQLPGKWVQIIAAIPTGD